MMKPNGADDEAGERPLESWKEIAAHLNRNEVTARRWEKDEGLPVHRQAHKRRSSVYAYPSELDAWRASRKVTRDLPQPARKARLAAPRSVAAGAVLALCLAMAGNGIRPQTVAAQQAAPSARLVWGGPGVDFTGQPSPDGRYLSFTDWETGNLGVRDLATGVNRFVTAIKSTAEGWAEGSVPSPDGLQLAYRRRAGRETTLQIMPIAGGSPRILPWGGGATYGRVVAWTPDGKQLLIIRSLPDRTQQLALVSVENGTSRSLKSLEWRYPRRVSLSPDGRYIAYDMPRDHVGDYDIFVLAANGGAETAAVAGSASDSDPVWSSDGSRLIFLSNRTGSDSLWTVPVRDGKTSGPAEQLRKGVGRMYPLGMSRTGALYYFSGGPLRNVHMIQLDEDNNAGGTPVRVSQRFVDDNARASWSPDGRSLAYYAPRGGAAIDVATLATLVVQSVETGEEREVSMRLLPIHEDVSAPPRWYPDSRSVLVAALKSPAESPGIGYCRVDVASGSVELLCSTSDTTHLARNPMLSPNGKTLYYGEKDELVRLDLESRRKTYLREWLAGKDIRSPALSPDGSQIAYLVVSADRTGVVEIMPAAGGPPREESRVTPWGGISTRGGIAWTPDGRHLLFARSATGDTRHTALYRVPAAGGQPQKIGIELSSGFLTYPQVHPGGRKLLYSTRKLGTNEVWVLENVLPKGEPTK